MSNIELLAGALEYMESHLGDDIKTEDVARACYCSKSTLEKLFWCVNGITIRQYLVKRRMTRAAKLLVEQPEKGILEIALECGYGTNESFTRAFKQVWNRKPSEFRGNDRYLELFPRLREPWKNGDAYMREHRNVDISELYDLFVNRKDCYFICCDIKYMIHFNDISYKVGDLAILTSMERMQAAAGEDDIVFRIGGDEFALLTASTDITYAREVAAKIEAENEKPIVYEGREVPLALYVAITKLGGSNVRYHELFTKLHTAIQDSKKTEINCE